MTTSDPFQQLEAMMSKVPGGSYFVAMIRNNPEAQAAIRSIDPARPDSMRDGMRRLFAAFGLTGPQADAMIANAMQQMQDPEAMRRMAEQAGFGDVAGAVPGFSTTPAPVSGVTAEPTLSAPPEPAPDPGAPPWKGLAQQASRLIADGSERVAFDRMTAALDDPRAGEYDPRERRWHDLTELLEVFAVEVVAAGRQIPPRFGALYQRAAFHFGAPDTNPPAKNPEFSSWCSAVARDIAGR